MKDGNNYDAVFAQIADSMLSSRTVRRPYICFIRVVHERVLDPLLRRGTPEEAVSNLKTRAREIFNIKKMSLSDKRGVGERPMIRYDDDNIVPRQNGVKR